MKRMVLFLAALVFGSLAPSASLATTVVDFESASDLNLFVSAEEPVAHAMGGVGGGGAVRVDSSALYPFLSLIYTPQSFSFSHDNAQIAVGMKIKYDQVTDLSNGGGIGATLARVFLLSDPVFDLSTHSVDVE